MEPSRPPFPCHAIVPCRRATPWRHLRQGALLRQLGAVPVTRRLPCC